MEADFELCCLSVVLAFVAAGSMGASLAAEVEVDRRRSASKTPMSSIRDGRLARQVRNGYAPLKPLSAWLLKRVYVRELVQEGVWLAAERRYVSTPEALLSFGLAAVIVLAVLIGVVTASFVTAIAVTGCVVAAVIAWVKTAQERRRLALRESVPDALRAMGMCFQAGLSLLQTFQQTAEETQDPIKTLFARASHVLETGGTTSEALNVFREGSSVPELSFVSVALDVQHQTGGSMRQVLEAARESVESELDLVRSLRVQTAQAKLSARIVSIMPFLLIALFSLVSEGFLAPFFASFTGIALLVVALTMQAAGVIVARRMLKVEVE